GASAKEVGGRLAADADPAGAMLAAVDCVAWLEGEYRAAVGKRETQSRELYAYYKAHFTSRNDPSDKVMTVYAELKAKNHEASELEKSATKGDSREERVAALACLKRLGAKNRFDVLRPCLEDQDPFVRRAAFATFASAGTRDVVDVLVQRTTAESGVASYDLQ